MTLTAPPSNQRLPVPEARVPLKLSSLKAIAGTIFEKPFEHWPSLAHKVPQAIYQRHYDVANVLWTVLVRGEG